MPNIQQIVQTVFTASTAGFTGGVSSVVSASSRASSAISGLTGLLAPLGAAVSLAGVTELGKHIIDVGNQFEMAKTQVGGFLNSLGFASSYTSGLKQADSVLMKIIADSAKLPGEAEEYIEVFKAGLPVVAAASGKAVGGVVEFTNRFAAVARTLGVNAGEAGVELQKMLTAGQGTAIIRSPMWRQLLTFLHTIPGQANLTTQAFNAMSSTKRFELLQQTLGKFGPMLDQASKNWDAQAGAIASNTRLMIRLSTVPIFEKAKETLGKINDLIMDGNGKLTPFARTLQTIGMTISTYIVKGFEKALDVATMLKDRVASIGGNLSNSPGFKMLGVALGRIGSFASTALKGAASGTKSSAIYGGVNVATHVSALDVFGKRLAIFTQPLDALSKTFSTISGYGTDLWQMFLQLQDAVNIVLQPIFAFEAEMVRIYGVFADRLRPTVQKIETAFGHLWHSGAHVLNPVFRILGKIIAKIAETGGKVLIPVLQGLGKMIAWVIERFSDLLDWIGKKLDKIAPKENDLTKGPSMWDDIMNTFDQLQKDLNKTDEEVSGEAKAPGAPAGAGVYQDFRGSKFDITQKFAEGYDPDRIAVAFAQDVGQVGEQRLQSAHEPLFGVR